MSIKVRRKPKRAVKSIKPMKKQTVSSTVKQNQIYDIGIKAIIICVSAAAIALAYTGFRAISGADMKPARIETPVQAAVPSPVQAAVEPTPVKAVPLPSKFRHFLKNVNKKEEIPKIHLEEAKALYESGKALFIDARGISEYNEAHIPGAINIMTSDSIEKIKSLEKELAGKILVPYCHGAGCHLSDKVAMNLFDAGYRKLAIYFGGWPEWTGANMPVVKYEPPPEYKHLMNEAASEKEIPEITLDEAKFLFDHNLANFIDTEYQDGYNKIHINIAASIPADKVDQLLPTHENFLKRKPNVVYCHGRGGKSRKTAEKLYKAGIKNVMVFIDAIPQWEKAGYPMYKYEPPQQSGRR